MKETLLNKSIILIGPKATGKSTVTSKFEEQNDDYLCFSTDLLINMMIYRMAGREKDLVTDPDYAKNLEKYTSLFKFDELDDMLLELGKYANNETLSPKVKQALVQFWKAGILELALYRLESTKPIFVDASADFGAVFDLSPAEEDELYKQLSMYPSMVLARNQRVLNQFGHIAYLEPGSTYHLNKQERASDPANTVFISNPESYKKYATTTLSAEGLFLKNGHSDTAILNEEKLAEIIKDLTSLKNTKSFE